MATTKQKYFEEELCNSPQKLESIFSQAKIFIEDKNFSEALDLLQKLVEHDPFEKKYWAHLGFCSQNAQKHKQALEAWAMSILIDSKDPMCHFATAECYLALDQKKEALLALKECRVRVEENHPLREKIEQLTNEING